MTPDADWWDRPDLSDQHLYPAAGGRVSVRRWRLVMAAAVRDARRHHLLPAVRDACSLAERLADGLLAADKLADARRAVRRSWNSSELRLLLDDYPDGRAAADAAGLVFRGLKRIDGDPARLPALIREVVGNPFRWVRWEDDWVTRTAHALAADAYARGRWDGLPVLADALDDAGCDNEPLLAHLRGPGPHVRGCWAVDVVLGKV